MPIFYSPDEFLRLAGELPVADVRSPGEFENGHIPGAANLPLFSNEERAEVGTLYKQQGQEPAMFRGLQLIGPRMADLVREAQQLAPDKKILLHCWRGGMRSASVAWLLDLFGFEVGLLVGGYKAYRQLVLQSFYEPRKLVILGGRTGSAKTEVLAHLRAMGQQIIDLEGLAHHKGSVFGALGLEKQPPVEMFENNLHQQWASINPEQPLWLEDESHAIGRIYIPSGLWQQMLRAPVVNLQVPAPERVAHLVKGYAGFAPTELAEATQKVAKRLGPQNTKEVLSALSAGEFSTAAMILLRYYDQAYDYGLQKRQAKMRQVQTDTADPFLNAQRVLAAVSSEAGQLDEPSL